MALTVDEKALKATKFPPEFNKRVDMGKVNKDIIRNWMAKKLPQIMGMDDDIIIDMVYNYIDDNKSVRPNLLAITVAITYAIA